MVQKLFAQNAPSLRALRADLHDLVELRNDEYGQGGIRALLAPFEDKSAVLADLELEQVSEQCIKDLLHSRLHSLFRLSMVGDAKVQDLELYDKVDWKRRLSIKYPAAEVTLQDTTQ